MLFTSYGVLAALSTCGGRINPLGVLADLRYPAPNSLYDTAPQVAFYRDQFESPALPDVEEFASIFVDITGNGGVLLERTSGASRLRSLKARARAAPPDSRF